MDLIFISIIISLLEYLVVIEKEYGFNFLVMGFKKGLNFILYLLGGK